MKRREPIPDLTRILDDSRPQRLPMAAVPRGAGIEKRIHTRFDKVFLVAIGSELYGDSLAIARNVSAGGILVEMSYAPPLGTIVTVHFQYARDEERVDEIVVRSEVKHHHYLNFTGSERDGGEAASTRAIGLRFLEFVDLDDAIDPRVVH